MVFENLEEARKNRERIAELQRKEAAGEKPEPSQRKQPLPKSAMVEAKVVAPNETKPTPLEDYEPGVTREQFFDVLKKVTRPVKPMGVGTPSMQLNFALGLLRKDSIKAFTQDYEQRVSQYGKDSNFDAYMEALIERNDLLSISKMLKHWIKYLEALRDCQHTRGAIMVLHTLDGLCLFIEGMRPSEVESDIEL